MKNSFCRLLAISVVSSHLGWGVSSATAHSGGTDARGCHVGINLIISMINQRKIVVTSNQKDCFLVQQLFSWVAISGGEVLESRRKDLTSLLYGMERSLVWLLKSISMRTRRCGFQLALSVLLIVKMKSFCVGVLTTLSE